MNGTVAYPSSLVTNRACWTFVIYFREVICKVLIENRPLLELESFEDSRSISLGSIQGLPKHGGSVIHRVLPRAFLLRRAQEPQVLVAYFRLYGDFPASATVRAAPVGSIRGGPFWSPARDPSGARSDINAGLGVIMW